MIFLDLVIYFFSHTLEFLYHLLLLKFFQIKVFQWRRKKSGFVPNILYVRPVRLG